MGWGGRGGLAALHHTYTRTYKHIHHTYTYAYTHICIFTYVLLDSKSVSIYSHIFKTNTEKYICTNIPISKQAIKPYIHGYILTYIHMKNMHDCSFGIYTECFLHPCVSRHVVIVGPRVGDYGQRTLECQTSTKMLAGSRIRTPAFR